MTRARALWAVVILVAIGGCRSGQPLLVSEQGNMSTPGTIGGYVSAVGGDRLPGRQVTAVHTTTKERYTATTSVMGGFSIKVPPGDYRLEIDLRDGEKVVKEPGVIHINKSDLDANMEIVVGS